jgi:thymidylate kinase
VENLSPPLFCFTGIDGCGKSTQVRRLARRLRAEGRPTATVWTGGRKTVTGPLVRLGQSRLRAPRRGSDRRFAARQGGQPELSHEFSTYLASAHRLFKRHPFLGKAWADLSLIEHSLEIDWAVWPHLLRHRAVICDRYMYRSVINLAVLLDLDESELPRLLRHPALLLVPRPTCYFLLDVPAEVGYQRKIDLPSLEYVARRVPLYRALAAFTGMPVIDAAQDPDIVEEQVWSHVQRVLRNLTTGLVQRMDLRLPAHRMSDRDTQPTPATSERSR